MSRASEMRSPSFRDKFLATVLLALMMVSIISNVRQSSAFSEDSIEVLPMHTLEAVSVFSNGDAELSIQTNIPDSHLADIYRKTLAVPSDIGVGQEISIPESTMQNGVLMPVRQEYLRSVRQEQKLSFGFATSILDSSIVPKDWRNGCKIFVRAIATLQVVNVTSVGSDGVWEVLIGPRSMNATGYAMGNVITKITFAQMLLKSMEGEQVYESSWTTRINLPASACLLNREDIDGLSWTLSFGGGTFTSAFVFVEEPSTIILDERTVITEQNITKSPTELFGSFFGYKVFKVKYLLPNSASTGRERLESGDFEKDWSNNWSWSWSDTATVSFDFGDHSVSLTVTPSISLSAYVGWDFDWTRHEWHGIPYWTYDATWFEAWIAADASVKISLEVTTTVGASQFWERELFNLILASFTFYVGPVPVSADLTFKGYARLSVSVDVGIAFTVETDVGASFKAGARWTRGGGWSSIHDADAHAELIGPTIVVHQVQASITPSLEFQLALLFYGVSGPYVGFEPYITGTITYYPAEDVAIWEITVGFKINTGVLFRGWLADYLDLTDVSYTIYERQLEYWSDHWGLFPSSISIEVAPNPTYKGGGTMISGEISSNWPGRKDGQVSIEYSGDGGNSWNGLASIESRADGEYAYWWLLSQDGNFTLRSQWAGNSDYKGATSQTTSLTVDLQAIGEAEVGQDDANPEGVNKKFYPEGFAVRFYSPNGAAPWLLGGVKMCGRLSITGVGGGVFEVRVLNSALQVLFQQTYGGSDYFGKFSIDWAVIPIPEIMVSSRYFYVCVFVPVPGPKSGYVEVGVDTTTPYNNSFFVTDGDPPTFVPLNDRNFMIHAYGVSFLEAATLCKGISGSIYNCDPVDPAEVFYAFEDQQIYSWVKLHGAPFSTEHLIEWVWYDPTGEYHITTNRSTPAGWSGKAYSMISYDHPAIDAIVKDWLKTRHHQLLGCPFKVRIYFDGTFIGQLTFRLTLHESSITTSSPASVITLGQSLQVSSQLSPSLSSGTTYLQYSNDQSTWTAIASGTPANGYFSYEWIPSSAGLYYVRAKWSGTLKYFSCTSTSIPIQVNRVTTALSVSISPTTITQGSNVSAAATITPKLQGKTIIFQSSSDNVAWFCVGSGITGSNGQCNCTWTPIRLGNQHYVRAIWYGDSDFKEANSTSKIFTIKIPPTTTLAVEEQNVMNNSICLTSKTLLTLTPEDTSGSGIQGTFYRVYNATYDTTETAYTKPFNITGLSDGEYIVDYYSRDNAGVTELPNKVVILLDNCPPIIETPSREPAGDVQPDQQVKILVAVIDNTTRVKNVTLFYTTNDGADWTSQLMLYNQSTNLYGTIIPAQQAGTFVEYMIVACDQTGNNATKDKTCGYCTYQVVPEYQSVIGLLLLIFVSTMTLIFVKKKWPTRNSN